MFKYFSLPCLANYSNLKALILISSTSFNFDFDQILFSLITPKYRIFNLK